MANPGKLLTHQWLLRKVWGQGYGTETTYLRTYVRALRKKLGDDASSPALIITEPGVGYRWVAEPARERASVPAATRRIPRPWLPCAYTPAQRWVGVPEAARWSGGRSRRTRPSTSFCRSVMALPVFSSDPLSSVRLRDRGDDARPGRSPARPALSLRLPIALGDRARCSLIVVTSYRQTVRAYPRGGGSYIVAKENLGTLPGLLAAAAILTDYMLTVAVSVTAGTVGDRVGGARSLAPTPGPDRGRARRAGDAREPARREGGRDAVRGSDLRLRRDDRDHARRRVRALPRRLSARPRPPTSARATPRAR